MSCELQNSQTSCKLKRLFLTESVDPDTLRASDVHKYTINNTLTHFM